MWGCFQCWGMRVSSMSLTPTLTTVPPGIFLCVCVRIWWVHMHMPLYHCYVDPCISTATLCNGCEWYNHWHSHTLPHSYLIEEGFYNFHNWFDDRAWYPLGRIIGGTIYPGMMVTSAIIHYFLNALNVTINVRNMCVFLAPLFSSFTVIITYHLTKELKDSAAGLVAAAMIAIVPGYISRSVAGSYDNEGEWCKVDVSGWWNGIDVGWWVVYGKT